MIRCAASHGPRSTPVRTSERGAGTRQAPCRQASHISSQEASKATDSPASTRSPGPIGSSTQNSRASASTNAAAARWLTATPFGLPGRPGGEDDPRVVAGPGVPGRPTGAPRGVSAPPSPSTAAHPGLAEHQLGPLLRVVGVDRHVGGAGRRARPGSRRTARRCRTRSAPRPGRRRRCRCRPAAAGRRRPPRPARGSSAPRRRHRPRPRGVPGRGRGEHVEQRALGRAQVRRDRRRGSGEERGSPNTGRSRSGTGATTAACSTRVHVSPSG